MTESEELEFLRRSCEIYRAALETIAYSPLGNLTRQAVPIMRDEAKRAMKKVDELQTIPEPRFRCELCQEAMARHNVKHHKCGK